MRLSKEQFADHLLKCQVCRLSREKVNKKIQKHMDQMNDHEICGCCGVPKHMKICSKCRFQSLKLYNVVSLHLKVIRIRKLMGYFFGWVK